MRQYDDRSLNLSDRDKSDYSVMSTAPPSWRQEVGDAIDFQPAPKTRLTESALLPDLSYRTSKLWGVVVNRFQTLGNDYEGDEGTVGKEDVRNEAKGRVKPNHTGPLTLWGCGQPFPDSGECLRRRWRYDWKGGREEKKRGKWAQPYRTSTLLREWSTASSTGEWLRRRWRYGWKGGRRKEAKRRAAPHD